MKLTFLKNVPKWKIFPSVDTLGYYNSLGNYIYLEEFKNQEDFEKALADPSLDKNRYSVYIHEQQHYIDQISTLWGVKMLHKIYGAYDAVLKNRENVFYKHRELNLNLKRDYFLDYYTVIYNHIEGNYKDPWKFQITSGLRYDYNGHLTSEFPIPFISFASSKDERISRVPLSVVSLLETTATNVEYSFLTSEALKLASPFRENQLEQISKKLEKKLYHPELTHYSAAVHLIAVQLKITDPIIAYNISSIFAKIALNFPSELFKDVPFPSEIESLEWVSRSNKMMENLDRGYLFYLLLRNYAIAFGGLKDIEKLVEDIFSASKLPNENTIQKMVQTEIGELDKSMLIERNNFNKQIIDKVFFGNKWREGTGLGQNRVPSPDIKELERDKPYIIFPETYFEYDDLDLSTIFGKVTTLDNISIEEWFRLYTYCEQKIDEFNEICGI